MSLTLSSPVCHSPLLASIQCRPDAPFGLLFLGIAFAPFSDALDGKVTTQTNDETTNDGKSKLDPIYDEDEDDDEEIPEKY